MVATLETWIWLADINDLPAYAPPPRLAHQRRPKAGALTTPTDRLSPIIKAIRVAHTGTPRTKFLVPSIGSITQRRGPQPVSPISSPCTASRGRARLRVRRMACSAAVSASDTGVRSGLAVTCRSSDLEPAHGDRVGVVGEQMGQPEVVGQAAVERIVRPCSRGVGDGHVPYATGRNPASGERLKPGGREIAVRNGSVQCALRRCVIVAATAGAVFGDGPQIVEGGDDPVTADMAEAEGPNARGVDHPGVRLESGSRSAMAEDDMCRPRPVTAFTAPIARSAPGIKALTSVDLPTPEWPTKTLRWP